MIKQIYLNTFGALDGSRRVRQIREFPDEFARLRVTSDYHETLVGKALRTS